MSSVAVFSKASPFDALQRWLPKLVLAPSMFIVLVGFYGYILWTFVLSFTTSTFLPSYKWAGLAQYARLFDNDRWWMGAQILRVAAAPAVGFRKDRRRCRAYWEPHQHPRCEELSGASVQRGDRRYHLRARDPAFPGHSQHRRRHSLISNL